MAKKRTRKLAATAKDAESKAHTAQADHGEEYGPPPSPLRLDELVTALKPRPPKKRLADAEIQHSLLLASDDKLKVSQSVKAIGEEGAGAGYELSLRVQGAAIGRHVLPPKPARTPTRTRPAAAPTWWTASSVRGTISRRTIREHGAPWGRGGARQCGAYWCSPMGAGAESTRRVRVGFIAAAHTAYPFAVG